MQQVKRSQLMKAVVYNKFGKPDVLKLSDNWPKPEIDDDSVLIQTLAGSINPKDVMLRQGKFKLIAKAPLPRVTGLDISGKVVAVGKNITHVLAGDMVFGMTNKFAGGVHSEFALFQADELAKAPANLSAEEASAIPLAAQTALQTLRDYCKIKPGQTVLINGASGGVGHFAVQIAKILGAQVHAICGPSHINFVSSLGADQAYDYSVTPPQNIKASFDAVFDIFGNCSRKDFKNNLCKKGVFVTTVPSFPVILKQGLSFLGMTPHTQMVIVKSNKENLEQIKDWVEKDLLKPHIDKVYSAEDADKAHAHIEGKHTTGKVVLSF
jgi:NADPH:quinone reductase-like Zn-dependent oxidoreductase